jgi:signal peptidase II
MDRALAAVYPAFFEMHVLLRRVAVLAALVAVFDEVVKTTARLRLEPCSSAPVADCDRVELLGPLWLVRTVNAGSALGFRQGWWAWIVLAAMGLLLTAVYGRWLRNAGWPAAIAVGLQVGGALPNLLDRVVFGGASDVLYLGGPVTWNVADVALATGTLVATWALARRLVPSGWSSGATRPDTPPRQQPSQ